MANRRRAHQGNHDKERIRKVWLEFIEMGHDSAEMKAAFEERFDINWKTVHAFCRDLPRPHIYANLAQKTKGPPGMFKTRIGGQAEFYAFIPE